MLISKGPRDWHSGHDPGRTSWFWDWKKGPKRNEHFGQSYLTMLSWGKTPVLLDTTPLVRINWFKCSCLKCWNAILVKHNVPFSVSAVAFSLFYSDSQSKSNRGWYIYVPKWSNFFHKRQFCNSNMNFCCNAIIMRKHGKDNFLCSLQDIQKQWIGSNNAKNITKKMQQNFMQYLVKYFQHFCWSFW